MASFRLGMLFYFEIIPTTNESFYAHWGQENGLIRLERLSWWLIFVACPLCLIILNVVVNSTIKHTFGVTRRQGRGHGMEGVLKEGVPTDEDIFELAFHIMDTWKLLGRALGIPEALIINIKLTDEDAYERAYSMLLKWRQRGAATYKALAQALDCDVVGRPDLSHKFCYIAESGVADTNVEESRAA